MGLDLVELTMEVEDEFGVYIPDSEAERMRTVGDVHQFLLRQKDRPAADSATCLTSAVFYRIRRALMKTFRIPRRLVRPESRLDVLIPAPARRAGWITFSQALMFPLPALRRPAWVTRTAWTVPLVICGYLTLWLLPYAPLTMIFAMSMAALLLAVVFLVATEWMRCIVPTSCVTVEGLARYAAVHHQHLLLTPTKIGTPDEVWLKLKDLIVRQLGVAPEDVRPEARWYEDLGAG